MHSKPTLLCVDDEPNVLEVLKRMFERSADVLTATSGAEGLALLRSTKIDLLITDQKMPGMTGMEMLRTARKEGIDVTAILLTAYTNPTDIISAINDGQVYRFVTKPWDITDLSMTVKNALERTALRREKDRLHESLRKRMEALSVMYEVSRKGGENGGLALEAIVDRLLSTVGRVLPHDASAVLIEAGEGRSASLRILCRSPISEAGLLGVKESVLANHRRLAGVLLTEDRVITNVSGPSEATEKPLSAFPGSLSVPLISGPQTVGTLALFSSRPDAYTPEDGELLDVLVNQTTDAITHVRAAEREGRTRIERMVDTMSDGVVLTDEKGEVVVVNAAARALLELTETSGRVTLERLKALLGLSPFEMVRGWEYGGRKTVRDEVELAGKKVELVVSPVAETGKPLRGVLVVLHDVSEQKLLEQRKDEFVSVVSHELRTPLTSIAGALDLVLNNLAGDVTEKQRRFLSMARDSAEKLNALVDDLLDLSKYAQGRMRMYFEITNLDELVANVVEKYTPVLTERELACQVEVTGPKARVLADGQRITQVLNNLIANAVKFAPRKGQLKVSVGADPGAPGFVALTVWNSGDPIDEKDIERIFDRFEQARTAKNRGIPGTGLGLAISRNIVESHGGRIWAEPTAGGARFVVVLPAEPPAEPPAVVDEGPVQPRGTVLVVEDDPELAWVLKAMLLSHDVRVVIAPSGEEALVLARKHKPDIISVDQRLPDIEGLKLLHIFRHDPETKNSRLMMVSGVDVREEAKHAGAEAYLSKPVMIDKLMATVDSLLAGAGRQRGKVLVVDDDPQIVAIASEVLLNLGFEVDRAGSVDEARSKVRSFRPDLLLLDVGLPDGDGFHLLEELKSERASAPLSVVFVSARSDTSAKVRALKLGGDDYLTKPFDALELGARVESVLRRRSAEALASPTTQLPGSAAIEREVQRRLSAKERFAFCYLDLDNLKAYNDYYGFAKADGVVRQTGDLLREVFARYGAPGDFVGHVAGDDFVFMTRPEAVDELCLRVVESFDRVIPLYYDRVDRDRGYIEAEDRYGEKRKFPLMSVSIVAVMSDGTLDHPGLARQAAEMKKRAKAIPGSVFLRNDRAEPVKATADSA